MHFPKLNFVPFFLLPKQAHKQTKQTSETSLWFWGTGSHWGSVDFSKASAGSLSRAGELLALVEEHS